MPTRSYAAGHDAPVSRTRQLAVAALVAGLMAATAWISIPFGAVPFTLQTAFVVLAALLLSPGWSAASMTVYVLLGAAGLPVFAGLTAGIGALAGPTGGFIVGFIPAAFLGSLAFGALRKSGVAWIGAAVVGAVVAEMAIYAVGVPWLMAVAGLPMAAALAVAVVPFVVPDAIKCALAISVAAGLRRALGR